MKKKQKKQIKKRKQAKKHQIKKSQALVIRSIGLTPEQIATIQAPTPAMFIKSREGKGGMTFKYVETGYIVSKLNQTFGPLNWQFEIVEEGLTERKVDSRAEGEVWVRGRLTVIDHKNNYKVSKEQYGQHPIHPNITLGDAKKAAASDCLKKCASFGFGIALDIYWPQLDEEKKTPIVKQPRQGVKVDPMRYAVERIKMETDPTILREMAKKIQESNIYKPNQKEELINKINAKI